MNNAIDIRNLHVRFDDGDEPVEALRGINVSIRPGERVAIIGRSGSGKSTLLRVLSGLVTPDRGHVQVGENVLGPQHGADREMYRDVGLVFQDYGLVPQLTAAQNVMCGSFHTRSAFGSMAGFGGRAHQRACQLLTELGLGDRVDLRASRLSGGEQQRVAIARLLFQNPSIMLLDEPVASLDIHWAKKAVDMMTTAGTADDPTTLVMVLHDLSLARQFADRVIYLHEGRVLFDGDPHEACCQLEDQPTKIQPPAADGSVLDKHHRPPTPKPANCPEGHACDDPPPPCRQTAETNRPLPPPSEQPDTGGPLTGLWGKSSFYSSILLVGLGFFVWAVVSLWSELGLEFSFAQLAHIAGNTADFAARMWPPDFSSASMLTDSIVETIQMALIGTTFAAILSLPIAVMAARNVSPRPIQFAGRMVLNGLRTIPSLIWALFFVAIVGLGPLAGIMALTLYAAGYLGKFYYEGIESIDPGPVHSLKTVGASRIQQFRWGVFPQVLPLMVGYTLYMFEYNVRAATILGIVGAGGIGFHLYFFIETGDYHQAAAALLLLLAVVSAIDWLSSRLRAKIQD